MGVGIFRPLLYDHSPFPFPLKVVGHKVLFKLTFHLLIKKRFLEPVGSQAKIMTRITC